MIYIVRHGQTNWNLLGRYQGRKDIELNNTGVDQAKTIALKLKNVKFDLVFSSPLKRAYETAKIISKSDIIKDARIIERSNGRLEGELKETYKSLVDFTDINNNQFEIEPLMDFRERINNFLDEIIAKHKDKNILIVTHAGVSIYMKCYFEGEPADANYSALKLKNCEVQTYDKNQIQLIKR